jgi:hypothetical protein
MAFQQRDNNGILGANRKREEDSHPTHTGNCVIDGKAYWISGWVKEGRDGSRFFSLAFKLKDGQQPAAADPGKRPASQVKRPEPIPGGVRSALADRGIVVTDDPDDIPFSLVAHGNHLKNMAHATS